MKIAALIIPYSHNCDKIIITVKNIKTNHSLMINILFLSCLAYEWPWKNVKTNKKIWTGEVVWFKSMPQYCKVKEINIKHARLCTSCYKNLTKHSSNAMVRLKYIYTSSFNMTMDIYIPFHCSIRSHFQANDTFCNMSSVQ